MKAFGDDQPNNASSWRARLLLGGADVDQDGGLTRYGECVDGSWPSEVSAVLAGAGLNPTADFLKAQEARAAAAKL